MIWFIFLCLLFVKGLAQDSCPKPQNVTGALIENVKDQDKTRFLHNETLVYICQPGRNISGESAERTCVNGTWTEVKFKCKKLSCPDLGVIQNGRIEYENPNRGIFSMAFYECDANTDLFLNSTLAGYDEGTRECQMDQQWSGPSELHCKKRSTGNKAKNNCKLCRDIQCRKPVKEIDIFKHGTEIYSRPMSEKFEMFRNKDGYLDKDVIKHKQTDGQWEKPFPKCIGARCRIKNNLNVTVRYTNGSATGLHVPSSSSYDVIVACKLDPSKHELKGFFKCNRNPDGSAQCKCNKGVLKLPNCKPRKCLNNDLPNIPKSVSTKSDPSQRINYLDVSKHTSKTFLRCYDKHELLDSVTNTYKDATDVKVTCDFGKWIPNSDSLACVPRRCNVKALIQQNESQVWTMTGNGLYQSLKDNMEHVEHGILVYMNCTVGFDLKTNDGRKLTMANDTCIKGTLNLQYTCQLKSCEKPLVKNGRLLSLTDNQRNVKHNEQIRIKCDTKYEIFNNDGKVANELIATCDKGTWNEREIICKPKRCLLNVNDISKYWFTEDIKIVPITKDSYIDHGMRVSTECKSNDGYILTDSHGLTSESSKRSYCFYGKWQYPYSCDFRKCPLPVFNEGTIKLKTGAVVNGIVTHSEKITFECNSPSRFDISTMDNTRVQSLDATCRLGNWSVPTPTCHPKRCLLKINESSKSWYTNDESNNLITEDIFIEHGMDISTECNDGYILTNTQGNTLDNSETAQCNFGVWQNEYNCTAKPCEIPNVNNGMMLNLADSQQLVKHNEQLTIRCDAQYEIFSNDGQAGDELITTCDKGIWNEKEIVCKPKRCLLKMNDNSKYRDTKSVVITEERFIGNGMNISIECKDGYILNNTQGQTSDTSETAKCNFGVWQNEFQCTAKSCKIPEVSNGIMLSLTDNQLYVKHNKQLTIKCDAQYELFNNDGQAGDELITMCDKGNWNVKEIVCKPKRCLLKVKENSKSWYTQDQSNNPIKKDGYIGHGMNISTECHDGYILTNTHGNTLDTSKTTRCNFGVWQNEFQCTAKPCEIPVVNNGRMLSLTDSRQYVKHNEQLTIKCEPKHELFNNGGQAGDELITTCDKGIWNVKEIVCKPKRCTLNVTNIASKFWITTEETNREFITKNIKIEHDVKVNIQCNSDGFYLASTKEPNQEGGTIETAVCNYGIWENLYSCKRRECKLSFTNGTVTVNNKTRTTDVLYEGELATVECTSELDMFDSSGELIKHSYLTTCRNRTLTKPLPFCKDRCYFSGSSNWQALRIKSNATIKEQFVQHGKKVHVQCNDGFDYKTDDVNTTTVYVCNDAWWIPTLPVCQSKTTSNESQLSSTTSHPIIDDLVTKRQDESSNVTQITSAVSKVTFTGEDGCVIDDQNRYTFYNTSGLENITLGNGAVVGDGTKVYVQCLAGDDYSDYGDYDEIDDEWHVTCTNNTFTPIPDDLNCTQVVECEYKVAKGELKKAAGDIGYYLNCNKGFTSTLQDSDTVSCKNGTLKSEYGLDPACNLDSDPCSIPIDMKNIEVTQGGRILTGGVTINHSETATFKCGKGKEPQGRKFKCVDGLLIAHDDDKDWTYANKGSFPQCRNAKCANNCNNHGVCVKDNVCECNVGYTGRLCDTDVACPTPFYLTNGTVLCEDASHLYNTDCDFICDSGFTISGTQRKMTCKADQTWSVSSSDVNCQVDCSNTCLANDGRCHTPNFCTCPETRYGNECLLSWCMGPQTNATVLNPKGKYNTNDKLRLTCPEGMQFSSEKDLECRSDGEWSHIVNCVPKQYNDFRFYSVVGPSKVDIVTLDIIGESGTVNNAEIKWSDNKIVTTQVHSINIGKIRTVIMKVNYSSLYNWFLPKWLSIYLRSRNEYCVWKLDRWIRTTLTITNNGGCSTFEEKEAVSVIGRYPTKAFIVTDDIQCKLICAKERNCKGVLVTFGKYFNICHMYDSLYNKYNTTRADDNWNQFLYRKLSES